MKKGFCLRRYYVKMKKKRIDMNEGDGMKELPHTKQHTHKRRKSANLKAKPPKRGRASKAILIVLIILLSVVFIFSAIKLIAILQEDQEGNEINQKIAQSYVTEFKEPVTGVKKYTIDFDALRKINPDICGWIASEGTVINYPVVQGVDNSFYLTHAADGTEHKYGAIFMDASSKPDFSDQNTAIYGHRMNSGAMFASLLEYQNQDYYEKHPYLMLYTPEKTYRLDIFSAYSVGEDENYIAGRFADDQAFESFLKKCSSRSLIKTGVEVSASDRIVTLSTCTTWNQRERFAVQAVLVDVTQESLS